MSQAFEPSASSSTAVHIASAVVIPSPRLSQYASSAKHLAASFDEEMVTDVRVHTRPAEIVETKLTSRITSSRRANRE